MRRIRMKKMGLLYLSVFCFFSWLLTGCGSTPPVIISSLDEIRQRSDPSKKLVVFFNETPASVNIITEAGLIPSIDRSANMLASLNNTPDLDNSDPKRRERAREIQRAAILGYYENNVTSIHYRSGRLHANDVVAFNLDSGDQIRLFVDGTVTTESTRMYRMQFLSIDIKPDINEQFYVVMDSGSGYVVHAIIDGSRLFSQQKEWRYAQSGFPSKGSKGYILFD
jgi:hypothetical protein